MNRMEKAACFIGHRVIPVNEYEIIKEHLENEIINIINQGVCHFFTSAALGFDILAAQTVLKLKEIYPDIKLTLILHCETPTKSWSEKNIKKFNLILNNADNVEYMAKNYSTGCMYLRNQELIDNSSFFLCFSKSAFGKTAHAIDYAHRKGLTVINLANFSKISGTQQGTL